MKEENEVEVVGPGVRRFGLNSEYARRLLATPPENGIALWVMTEREEESFPPSPQT